MKILKNQDKIEIPELKEMSKKMYGSIVKVVVDIEKEIMAVDAPMHSDLEEFLINQEDSHHWELWGINILPEIQGEGFIKFDSLINIKPGFDNRTMGIENNEIKNKIKKIVNNFIKI